MDMEHLLREVKRYYAFVVGYAFTYYYQP